MTPSEETRSDKIARRGFSPFGVMIVPLIAVWWQALAVSGDLVWRIEVATVMTLVVAAIVLAVFGLADAWLHSLARTKTGHRLRKSDGNFPPSTDSRAVRL